VRLVCPLDEETDDATEQVQRGADHRILKEHEAGLPAAAICRKYGISDATFYK
jgi:putative transposase